MRKRQWRGASAFILPLANPMRIARPLEIARSRWGERSAPRPRDSTGAMPCAILRTPTHRDHCLGVPSAFSDGKFVRLAPAAPLADEAVIPSNNPRFHLRHLGAAAPSCAKLGVGANASPPRARLNSSSSSSVRSASSLTSASVPARFSRSSSSTPLRERVCGQHLSAQTGHLQFFFVPGPLAGFVFFFFMARAATGFLQVAGRAAWARRAKEPGMARAQARARGFRSEWRCRSRMASRTQGAGAPVPTTTLSERMCSLTHVPRRFGDFPLLPAKCT